MNAKQRLAYFSRYWPAACAAQGWDRRDEARRRAVTAQCMALCGGPATESTTALDEAHITALFAYLAHLARPDDLRYFSNWLEVQERGASVVNAARQGDYWRRKAGYRPRGRLEKQRFGQRPTSGLWDAPEMDGAEAAQYLMTMRARAKAKARQQARAAGEAAR